MGGIVFSKWLTTKPILPQTTTLHFLNGQPLNQEAIVLEPTMTGGSNFIILMPYVVQASSIITAVVSKTVGAPGNALTVTGIPAGASVGQRLRNTTPGRQSIATIESITGGVATMSQPFTIAVLTTPTANPALSAAAEDNGWAVGDNLELLAREILNLQVLVVQGGEANAALTTPVAWVENAYIVDGSGVAGNSSFVPELLAGAMVFSGCQSDPFFFFDGRLSSGGIALLLDCDLASGCSLIGSSLFGGFANGVAINGQGARIDFDAIINVSLAIQNLGNQVGAVNLNSQAFALNGGELQLRNVRSGATRIWGSGAIDLRNNGSNVSNLTQPHVNYGPPGNAIQLAGPLLLNSVGTGSSYNPGTGIWTSGIPITPAAIDATGLQNPITGTRYA